MTKILDITGERFGRLKAIRIDHRKGCKTFWLCQCDCGNAKVINVTHLMQDHTRSCGCIRTESFRRIVTVHGLRKKDAYPDGYGSWRAIWARCINPKCPAYKDYGARGIKICDRWCGEMGFPNFMADMGPRPSNRHSVGRINNEGDYCPENCRWENATEQGSNTRRAWKITHNGKTQCLSAWSRETGISVCSIRFRLKHGWTVERALSTPRLRGLPSLRNKTAAMGCANQGAANSIAPEWELTG